MSDLSTLYPALLGLPEQQEGHLSGENGLFRLNLFNGRLLDARSLTAEQSYGDLRERLNGLVWGPGVAWGLTVELPGATTPLQAAPDRGGHDPKLPLIVRRGLGIDGQGSPLALGADLLTTPKALAQAWVQQPARVTRLGPGFDAAAFEQMSPRDFTAGVYLLVLRPSSVLMAGAQPAVQPCDGDSCGADGVQFKALPSLVHIPMTLPKDRVKTRWDLRAAVADMLFDLWEQGLPKRWSGLFPLGEKKVGDLSAADGPRLPSASGVPLAVLVYGSDGTVLVCDMHAARRDLMAPRGERWGAAAIGAPGEALSRARLLQFQDTVDQALTAPSLLPPKVGRSDIVLPPSLRDMGLRQAPAAFVLPVKVYSGASHYGIPGVVEQILAYFEGSSVLLNLEVAAQDDTVLSELEAARVLDPVQLGKPPDETGVGIPAEGVFLELGSGGRAIAPFLPAMRAKQVTVEQLANHEVELLRVTLVLRGLNQDEPLVGGVQGQTESKALSHSFVLVSRLPPGLTMPGRVEDIEWEPEPEPEVEPTPPATITVTTPGAGQVLYGGDTHTLTWTTTNMPDAPVYVVELLNVYSGLVTPLHNAVSGESWDWAVPTDIPYTADNQIRVRALHPISGDVLAEGLSPLFTCCPALYATFVEPGDGSSHLGGSGMVVSWVSGGGSGGLSHVLSLLDAKGDEISLGSSPSFPISVAVGTPQTLLVTLPDLNAYGLRLYVKVTDSLGRSATFPGPSFSITQKAVLRIRSPHEGAVLWMSPVSAPLTTVTWAITYAGTIITQHLVFIDSSGNKVVGAIPQPAERKWNGALGPDLYDELTLKVSADNGVSTSSDGVSPLFVGYRLEESLSCALLARFEEAQGIHWRGLMPCLCDPKTEDSSAGAFFTQVVALWGARRVSELLGAQVERVLTGDVRIQDVIQGQLSKEALEVLRKAMIERLRENTGACDCLEIAWKLHMERRSVPEGLKLLDTLVAELERIPDAETLAKVFAERGIDEGGCLVSLLGFAGAGALLRWMLEDAQRAQTR